MGGDERLGGESAPEPPSAAELDRLARLNADILSLADEVVEGMPPDQREAWLETIADRGEVEVWPGPDGQPVNVLHVPNPPA